MKVYAKTYWNTNIEVAFITSEDRDGINVWLRKGNGERRKTRKEYTCKYNEANHAKLKRAADIEVRLEKLKADKKAILESLEKVFE